MVALLSGILRSDAVSGLEPCEHRLANMYSPVVHEGHFHHVVAACLEQPRNGIPEEIVPDVPEMEGLVGIR